HVVDLVRQRLHKTPAELAHLVRELPIEIAPFDQAQVRDEMPAAALDEPAMREPLGLRVGEELPQRDKTQEIRALVAKTQMRVTGGSRKGNAATSPKSTAAMRRITDASDERRISGSVKRGRAAKSSSP